MKVTDERKREFTLDNKIAEGGEAEIWSIVRDSSLVAKIYKNPDGKEAKLKAMLANPPEQKKSNHIGIAWPIALLYYNNRFIGFLMHRISGGEPVFRLYNPKARQKISKESVNHVHFHRIAKNFIEAVRLVHSKGHLIGDVNESNILVTKDSLVIIVDADSFQIKDKTGRLFSCLVGKAEYTPRELQGVDFKTTIRSIEHDLFGVSVILFQLFMEGYHPFAGVTTNGKSVERVDIYCIKNGIFPYGQQKKSVNKPPNAPCFDILPQEIQKLFIQCFIDGHHASSSRPTVNDWKIALDKTESTLKICKKNHAYYNHLSDCPWCNPAKLSTNSTWKTLSVCEKIIYFLKKLSKIIKEIIHAVPFVWSGLLIFFTHTGTYIIGLLAGIVVWVIAGGISSVAFNYHISVWTGAIGGTLLTSFFPLYNSCDDEISNINEKKDKVYFLSGIFSGALFFAVIIYNIYLFLKK